MAWRTHSSRLVKSSAARPVAALRSSTESLKGTQGSSNWRSVGIGNGSTLGKLVGAPGFEPGTSRTPSVRATRLRYAPTYFVRLSPAFEKGQESAQRIAHIEQHFAVQKLRCPVARRNRRARFRFSRSPALAQVPAGARNRESFVIKQAFDFPN